MRSSGVSSFGLLALLHNHHLLHRLPPTSVSYCSVFVNTISGKATMEKQSRGNKMKRFCLFLIKLFFFILLLGNSSVSCEISGDVLVNEGGDSSCEEREACFKGACDFKPSDNSTTDRILPHLLNLYGSQATSRDFEIYAPNATFEDPLMCAHGIKQIKSAFYSIPKVFGESRIVEYAVKENVISPSTQEILIDNKQHYKVLGKEIDMISLIKLQVEDGKIVRHEDRWDKKPLLNRETVSFPLVGRLLETTRRGSMLMTHAMMRFGKDPTV